MVVFVFVVSLCFSSSWASSLASDSNSKSAEKEQIDYLIRSFTSIEFPVGTRLCDGPENCNTHSQRCDSTTKLCTGKEVPEFPLHIQNVSCSDDRGCPFFYKCSYHRCEYTLFRACRAKSECFQNCGLEFECLERNLEMPGKKCYRKCQRDRDCYDCNGESCRYPDIFQKLLTCCNGYCSKRIACQMTLS